jgi:hypothetical protein
MPETDEDVINRTHVGHGQKSTTNHNRLTIGCGLKGELWITRIADQIFILSGRCQVIYGHDQRYRYVQITVTHDARIRVAVNSLGLLEITHAVCVEGHPDSLTAMTLSGIWNSPRYCGGLA